MVSKITRWWTPSVVESPCGIGGRPSVVKRGKKQDWLRNNLTWSTVSVWVPTSHHGNHTQNSCKGASAHGQEIDKNWWPWHSDSSPKSKWKVCSRPIGIFQVRKKSILNIHGEMSAQQYHVYFKPCNFTAGILPTERTSTQEHRLKMRIWEQLRKWKKGSQTEERVLSPS